MNRTLKKICKDCNSNLLWSKFTYGQDLKCTNLQDNVINIFSLVKLIRRVLIVIFIVSLKIIFKSLIWFKYKTQTSYPNTSGHSYHFYSFIFVCCRLTYIEAILLESQRLGNTAPVTPPHRAKKDTVLNGCIIPKVLLLAIASLNQDQGI